MVTVVEYDEDWPAEYERAAAQLRTLIPDTWAVEHIGSTSVPGLAAKPIIDLAVRVPAPDAVDAWIERLRAIGWLPIAGGPQSHRVLVRMRGEERTHIAHFFRAEEWETVHQRVFADWLRSHPADRDTYAAVKQEAARHAEGGRDYTLRKRAVVQEITNRARAARGLPPVDTWDK